MERETDTTDLIDAEVKQFFYHRSHSSPVLLRSETEREVMYHNRRKHQSKHTSYDKAWLVVSLLSIQRLTVFTCRKVRLSHKKYCTLHYSITYY